MGQARPHTDVTEHRLEVVQRLLQAGVPTTVLQSLLPGWEGVIADAEEAVVEVAQVIDDPDLRGGQAGPPPSGHADRLT